MEIIVRALINTGMGDASNIISSLLMILAINRVQSILRKRQGSNPNTIYLKVIVNNTYIQTSKSTTIALSIPDKQVEIK